MSHYDDIRNRIHRQMVPLPILFREDYSVDTTGMAKYVAWHMEQGTKNFCLTFTYSQLDFVSREEIVDITKAVMEVVRDDAVFLTCTGGGPLHEAIETVREFEKLNAHGAFVHLPEHCLQNPYQCSELYVRYIQDVAKHTKIPLLAVALGIPWVAPIQTMLPTERIADLCETEQFIGIKDDIYILENRFELSRRFAGRMGITGGGRVEHYILFHHLPNQGELMGIFNPKRSQQMLKRLDNNDYQSVLRMMDEDAQISEPALDLHWMARNQVVLYAMGFAETYLMRRPIGSATPEQVEATIKHMHTAPTLFERVVM